VVAAIFESSRLERITWAKVSLGVLGRCQSRAYISQAGKYGILGGGFCGVHLQLAGIALKMISRSRESSGHLLTKLTASELDEEGG
jgi:hypothetical protein